MRAQETPVTPQPLPPAVSNAQLVEKKTAQGNVTCLQPPPMVSWEDYQGPFAKVVSVFARKLERKSVRTPNYKAGAKLCTLEVKDKFVLFLEDTADPLTFLSAAFNAGIDQAQDNDPSYGQGAAGYGKRVGWNLVDQAQGDFFIDFAYPTIFSEDPRYYRLGTGSGPHRFLHAVEHSVVAYRENGTTMPNLSLWFGTVSSATLSNVYHPDARRGAGRMAERVGISMGYDIGYDVLREFWPDIARKFRLPFREQHEPQTVNLSGAQP